jgi:catechol 2,3-dioxygenase-like lactoylglutathione lyase family enzyme
MLRSLLHAGAAALALAGAACAQAEPDADPMRPLSSVEDATTSPMRAVTVMAGDLDLTRRFYQGALDMSAELDTLEGEDAQALAAAWGFDFTGPIDMVIFHHPDAQGAAIVRAIQAPDALTVMRPAYDSAFLGPLGFGFAGEDLASRARIVEEMGFTSTAGVKSMNFPRADGSTYEVSEIHYAAPDDILVLMVNRGDQAPVGPIDPALGVGGVAYASVMVGDLADSARFLGDVLQLEQRRDISFRASGEGGGMQGLDAGEEIAFQQWFSPGSTTGYLVIMERLEGEHIEGELGFEQRGVALWSFQVDDLDAVLARYAETAGEAAPEPSVYTSPGIGRVRGAVIENPDGLPVEVYEPAP